MSCFKAYGKDIYLMNDLAVQYTYIIRPCVNTFSPHSEVFKSLFISTTASRVFQNVTLNYSEYSLEVQGNNGIKLVSAFKNLYCFLKLFLS